MSDEPTPEELAAFRQRQAMKPFYYLFLSFVCSVFVTVKLFTLPQNYTNAGLVSVGTLTAVASGFTGFVFIMLLIAMLKLYAKSNS